MCTVYKDKEGAFVHAEDWHDCDMTFTIFPKNSSATLLVNNKQVSFAIISSHMVEDNEKDAIIKSLCTDSEGTKCGLILTTLSNTTSVSEKTLIKIEYGDAVYVYKGIEQ